MSHGVFNVISKPLLCECEWEVEASVTIPLVLPSQKRSALCSTCFLPMVLILSTVSHLTELCVRVYNRVANVTVSYNEFVFCERANNISSWQ